MDEMLSEAHIVKLTGYVQHAAQVRWLKRKGWKFELDYRGRPGVDRAYYNMRLGLPNEVEPSTEPDFKALYA